MLYEDLKQVITYLDELKLENLKGNSKRSELWRIRTRAAVLTQWHAGFRGSELVVHLRWEWLDLANSRINTPGGDVLKWQWGALTIPFETRSTDPQLDVHASLMALKAEFLKAGIPCGDEDRVFPLVAKNQLHINSWENAYGPPLKPWTSEVRDLLGEAEADLPADLSASERVLALHQPKKTAYNRWLNDFTRVCAGGGFTPRNGGEIVATHSCRRGLATEMHLRGGTREQISIPLRHRIGQTTAGYVEAEHRDTSGLMAATVARPHDAAPRGDLYAGLKKPAVARQETCEVVHIDGVRCGGTVSRHRKIDGNWLACCRAHYDRSRRGETGPSFTKPVRRQKTRAKVKTP
jgi:hypothetical protein